MKKVMIALVALVVLVVAVLGFAAYNAKSLIARFKPQIEQAASKALHADVKMGELAVSVFPSTSVKVSELKVSEAGSSQAFTLKDLSLDLNLMALLSKKLEITKLSIDSPDVTVIKDAAGFWIAGLPRPAQPKEKGERQANDAKGSLKQGESAKDGEAKEGQKLSMALQSFELSNAKVSLRDDAANQTYALANVTVAAAVDFADSLALRDLNVTGSVLSSGKLSVTGGLKGVGTDSGTLDLDGKLAGLAFSDVMPLAGMMGIKLPIELNGSLGTTFKASGSIKQPETHVVLNLTDSEISQTGNFIKPKGSKLEIVSDLDTKNLPRLAAVSSLSADRFELTKLGTIVTDINGKLNSIVNPPSFSSKIQSLTAKVGGSPVTVNTDAAFSGGAFTLSPITINGFGAETKGNFSITPQSGIFSVAATGSGLLVGELIPAIKPDAPKLLEGKLTKYDLKMSGKLGADLMNSLTGSTPVVFEDGKLIGMNLAGQVLQAINSLPFLDGSLFALATSGGGGSEVKSPDTLINKLTGDFTFGGGAINTKNMNLVSNVFNLEGSGSIGFNAALDLDATIIFSKAFSEALAARSERMSKVLDAQKRLVIPLTLKGTPPVVLVYPNVEKLLKLAGEKALTEGAEKLLDKALGGKTSTKGLGNLLGF